MTSRLVVAVVVTFFVASAHAFATGTSTIPLIPPARPKRTGRGGGQPRQREGEIACPHVERERQGGLRASSGTPSKACRLRPRSA
jgi:hypothetical protein